MLAPRGLRALRAMTKLITQRRGASEYSKKMGFKLKPFEVKEPKVNVPEILFCAGISFYFLYDIVLDRREHNRVLMESFDSHGSYSKHDAPFGAPPSVDFIIEKLFQIPHGDEDSNDAQSTLFSKNK